jgi:hypothetical protein
MVVAFRLQPNLRMVKVSQSEPMKMLLHAGAMAVHWLKSLEFVFHLRGQFSIPVHSRARCRSAKVIPEPCDF